ncbi:MAG: class I SAM-dependent methyltransferase [Elusimicrobiota bacterium]
MSVRLLEAARSSMNDFFPTLPWSIRLSRSGQSRVIGQGPERLEIACRTDAPLRSLARADLSTFLDQYVAGEADLNGDMYAFVCTRNHLRRDSDWKVRFKVWIRHVGTMAFPSSVRGKLIAVSSHYDLPNEFILSYLDTRTRAYSCAEWKDPANVAVPYDEPLEDAQHRKFLQAAQALQVQPDDKFIDLGCGYGYMTHLVETEFGCKDASGITLSKNQVDTGYSRNLKRMHYRELPPEGQYDKIYTCGMVSHLDQSEIRVFYKHAYGLLKRGGLFWMHGIVPPANDYGMTNYNSLSGTFSQRYVFPNHFQFPVWVHLRVMEETGFKVREVRYKYGHYNKTLRDWYRRFLENLPRTRPLINPVIERAWHLYLTYASSVDGKYSIIKQILATKD